MKKRIKKYIKSVRGEEILICIILVIGLLISYCNIFNNNFSKLGANVFDSLLHEENYKKAMLYYDSRKLSKNIYDASSNLEDTNKNLNGTSFDYDGLHYALINKSTGEIITNDMSLRRYIDSQQQSDVSEKERFVESYINKLGYINIKVDNVNRYNYYTTYEKATRNEKMKNYIEIYYNWPNAYDYMFKTDIMTAKIIIILTVVTILLLLKIVINMLVNFKNVSWDIRTMRKFVYILKYGFKYKYTRNKILISMISAAGIIIIYLYLVAGIRTENVLLTFLERYPFKGTLLIILIPLISIIYSLKKTLDISIINESLKKINEGEFHHDLYSSGENEINELVDNINQIKEGYKKAVEDKLRNERLKTELISNVSHDLKTPLTSIINYVNILKNKTVSEKEKDEYLDIIEKKSLKLKVLIADLFEISKLNSGKMILNASNLDIVSLMYQGVGEYCTLYEEKNIAFKIHSNKEEIFMNLDGKLMSRLFENVIINALKYSLPNTRVYIDIIDNGDFLNILFKNIANYEMNFDTEEIFEKFVRGDESRTSVVDGSGMGLAISKSILELHSGDMNIEVDGDMFKLSIFIPKHRCGKKDNK